MARNMTLRQEAQVADLLSHLSFYMLNLLSNAGEYEIQNLALEVMRQRENEQSRKV